VPGRSRSWIGAIHAGPNRATSSTSRGRGAAEAVTRELERDQLAPRIAAPRQRLGAQVAQTLFVGMREHHGDRRIVDRGWADVRDRRRLDERRRIRKPDERRHVVGRRVSDPSACRWRSRLDHDRPPVAQAKQHARRDAVQRQLWQGRLARDL